VSVNRRNNEAVYDIVAGCWCVVDDSDDDHVSERVVLFPGLHHSQHRAAHRQTVLEQTTIQTLVRGRIAGLLWTAVISDILQ